MIPVVSVTVAVLNQL